MASGSQAVGFVWDLSITTRISRGALDDENGVSVHGSGPEACRAEACEKPGFSDVEDVV